MSKTAALRRLSDNEASAKASNIRISPRKLGLVANLIKNMKAAEALVQLQFSRKRISGDVKKLLESAIANAENNHNLDIDRLIVSEIKVGKAMVMKRFHARARGRGAKVVKPFSNMEIIVRESEEE